MPLYLAGTESTSILTAGGGEAERRVPGGYMATRPMPERSRWFEVDGLRYESGPVTYFAHRIATALFPADLDAVQHRLPSPQLHPLRWLDGRALVWVSGLAYTTVHSRAWPLCRYGEMAAGIVVTRGKRLAPRLAPLAVPQLQSRYPVGNYIVQVCVTSRLFGHGGNVLMGTNKFLADVRNERRPGTERFVATEDGAMVYDLAVSTTGRPSNNQAEWELFTDHEGHLLSWGQSLSSTSRLRPGGRSATLVLGDHPAADDLRALGLADRPVAALYEPDRVVRLSQWPTVLGPATRRLYDHPGSSADEASYVVSHAPGVDVPIDQGLADLTFDLQGTWRVQPLADIAEQGARSR